jgi:hypothetical protein
LAKQHAMPAHASSEFFAVVAVAAAAVLLFESLGALASKRYGFPYANLTVAQWALYLLLGLFVQLALHDVRRTVAVALIAAALEAGAGWAIAARIGSGRAAASPGRIGTGMLLAIVTCTAAALCGATWLLYGVAWVLLRVRA